MSEKKKSAKKVREMSVRDVVAMYNVIKSVNIRKLSREVQRTVLAASRMLRPVAESYEKSLKDAQERLKPENFEDIVNKQQCFDQLSNDVKIEVTNMLLAFDRRVSDCMKSTLDSTVKIEYEELSQVDDDVLGQIADGNESISVGGLLLLEDALKY